MGAKPVSAAERVLPVVLAGGAGTRLWPLSRERYPKQFLPLVGERTMLQQTLGRLAGLAAAPPVIVCHHDHRFIVAEQCRALGEEPSAVVLEPVARNTAPALALAALRAVDAGDPVLLALPADGHIGSVAAFHAAVRRALPLAAEGRIVAFGATPDRPETGYGYIQAGPAAGPGGAAPIAAFVEKPTRSVAEGYLATGGYYWNSGMFAVRASVYLAELRAFRPAIHAACTAAVAAETKDLDFHRPGDAFRDSPADSIDYAVMEHTRLGMVVPTRMQWSDLGSWRALAEALPADKDGNTASGDVIAVAARGSHLASGSRLLAAIGVADLVVVETADAVLVASKAHVAEVKTVVERLRQAGRTEQREHTTAYRPWGHAETFPASQADAGYLVKRITVRPGESLSLQKHQHRAEHWVVVHGEATVQRGEDTFVVAQDESTYIPAGVLHRLTNRGPERLDVIEVQVGPVLSEDDIVRYDDRYGRE